MSRFPTPLIERGIISLWIQFPLITQSIVSDEIDQCRGPGISNYIECILYTAYV